MKKFRKMMALVIAMVMALAMGTSVFADNTINGAGYDTAYFTVGAEEVDLIGHTFNAVQIVKAASYDASKNPAYTGISWGAQITDDGEALLDALQEDTTLGSDFASFVTDESDVTETSPLFTAAAFADAIQNYDASELEALISVVKGLNLSGQSITVSENMQPVELTAGIGLYMIDDTTTSLDDDVANATILTAVPGTNKIKIKVDKPSQDKEVKENVKADWNEVSDYNIGDYVPYKITSKVPNAEKFDNYTMTFTDQMSSGLTFANRVADVADAYKLKVTVGDAELTAGDDYTLNATDDQNFTVTLPVKEDGTQNFDAGSVITIEFYGLLNSKAVIGLDGNTNKSKLTYSNNPDDDTQTTDTPWDTVITFTYELDVNKVDGATEAVLPGAQFALKATDGDHADKYVVVDSDGKITGWADAAPAADATDNGALLIADKNGLFKVIGLDDGTYSLEEIKAPAGYNKIDPITLVIKATTANGDDYTDDLQNTAGNALTALKMDVTANGMTETSSGDTSTGIVETTVVNNSGATLPETGGMGTTIFYIVGAILVIGAGVLLVTRRRMSAQ